MTGRFSLVPFSLTPSYEPRMLPFEFQGWDTPYVHDTVDVLAPEAGTTALGSAFGSREHINARVWESVRASDEMRSAIGSVDHATTEMVLIRQCADVSKLMYHMRINGDMLDQDLLDAFVGQLRAFVSASLNGDLLDHSWWQDTTGVTCGGLGLRTALGIALPAFVTSRFMYRPMVSTMVDQISHAFGVPNQLVMAEHDSRTDAALARLVSTLPPNTAFSWGSLVKPWLSASYPGSTSSPGSKRPCTISPLPLFDTREPSLRTAVMGRRALPGPETVEHPGPHHLHRHERAVKLTSRRVPGRLVRDCRNLGTSRSITRGCGA